MIIYVSGYRVGSSDSKLCTKGYVTGACGRKITCLGSARASGIASKGDTYGDGMHGPTAGAARGSRTLDTLERSSRTRSKEVSTQRES
jgi:hypothetical protein